MPQDSPLSITSSIAGILTFAFAIAAAVYVRFTYLRNADAEYFEVKSSLSWFKTESIQLHDLIRSFDPKPTQDNDDNPSSSGPGPGLGSTTGGGPSRQTELEYQMYIFILDQLSKLEDRLLELVTEAEIKASSPSSSSSSSVETGGRKWTLVPGRGWGFGFGFLGGLGSWLGGGESGIAVSWLGVRSRALELVRKREAVAGRVLFALMSMGASRVKDQEARERKREEAQRERLDRLEMSVNSQHEKLDRLEDLVYRVMHRSHTNRLSDDNSVQSHEEEYSNSRRNRRGSGTKSPFAD